MIFANLVRLWLERCKFHYVELSINELQLVDKEMRLINAL